MATKRSRKVLRGILICVVPLCLAVGLVCAFNNLPSLENRSVSVALTKTADTQIGRAIAERVNAHPGQSGIFALTEARDAFSARMLLADAAERTLDVQYYIWRNDMSGTLLFDALRRAAERDVRVRLLLDDNNTQGLDEILAALDAHPNVEVRLFNPFVIRNPRVIGYLTDFPRLNRRMHNKSFTADNQVTIIGGRNVGDEYFGATANLSFVDVDAMAIGPVVVEVSNDFDRYWASESSHPVNRLLPAANAARIQELESTATRIESDAMAAAYLEATRNSAFVSDLVQGNLAIEWAATRMISDDPAKGLGRSAPEASLSAKLKSIVGDPAAELLLVSPYFVPTAAGVDWFAATAGRGVKIKVLTNSLEATDVAAVHAGYAKRRKALLAAGITLFESLRKTPDTRKTSRVGMSGSSASSLHAKTLAVDGKRAFVGSFNFDPRSATLNTEMGFVIDSPELAQRIATAFNTSIPDRAYEVRLTDAGELYWLERQGGQILRADVEPGTTYWERVGVRFLSILPIESLL